MSNSCLYYHHHRRQRLAVTGTGTHATVATTTATRIIQLRNIISSPIIILHRRPFQYFFNPKLGITTTNNNNPKLWLPLLFQVSLLWLPLLKNRILQQGYRL
jgi:hypothetical protein